MSAVSGTNQETINFCDFPVYLQDSILEKMNFETYATFIQTGALAVALDERNSNNVYHMDVNRILIRNDHVYIEVDEKYVPLSMEMREKMKIKVHQVTVSSERFPGYFSKKTSDFLLKLGEINTLACPFLEYNDPNTAEVLTKTKIQRLKMATSHLKNEINDFQYDTSKINEIQVDDSFSLPFSVLSSIKAQKTVSLSNIYASHHEVFQYIEKITNKTEDVMDLILDHFVVDDFDQITEFLQNEAIQEGKEKWSLTRGGEMKAYLTIEIIEGCMYFKQC